MPAPLDRATIVAAATAALGTPFRHQGRDIGRRLDCAGLIVHVAKTIGFDVMDLRAYPELPNGELEATLARHESAGVIVRIPVAARQPGDIVLMRFEKERAPRHLGIIGNDDTLIHAWAVTRKVCEHIIDDAWRRRIVGAWQFSGVV
jgi:NlpC/P60 family putative phage cell wall peptidase